jgi:hypothetical protein
MIIIIIIKKLCTSMQLLAPAMLGSTAAGLRALPTPAAPACAGATAAADGAP